MFRHVSISALVFFALAISLPACNKSNKSDDDDDNATAPASGSLAPAANRDVSYTADVQPILQKYCQKCHLGSAHKGGFSLATRDSALQSGEHGARIVPGDSGNSRIIFHVSGSKGFKFMPPREPRLTAEEIGILRAWIDKGAKFE